MVKPEIAGGSGVGLLFLSYLHEGGIPPISLIYALFISRDDQLVCSDYSLCLNPVLDACICQHNQAHCQQYHIEEDVVENGSC
jgi:hypothetical protein